MRRGLSMRRGKECAMAGHASMAWLSNRIRPQIPKVWNPNYNAVRLQFTEAEHAWLTGLFTKVCVQVDTEEELVAVYDAARKAGLLAEMITDAGLTEFSGIPTKVCVALGPAPASTLDPITGHLKLY